MDSSSRRAFGLDSRTVWVEQQLVNDILIPRDNLPLGPGEYHAQIQERHVSTPSLGKFRGPADHFRSFNSDVKIRTPANNNGPYSHSQNEAENNVINTVPRSEFTTIFHEHDIRQPLDPNRRYCPTPGSYLGQDPLLRTVNSDGVRTIPKIHFGSDNVPFGERTQYKVALPDYDVQYDSAHIRSTTKLGSFDKEKRVLKLAAVCYYNEGGGESASPPKRSPVAQRQQKSSEHQSVYEKRCSSVTLPRIKTRVPEKLIFDDSSYKKMRLREKPLDLTPSKINKVAAVHLFNGLVAIPRKHVSTGFSSNMQGFDD